MVPASGPGVQPRKRRNRRCHRVTTIAAWSGPAGQRQEAYRRVRGTTSSARTIEASEEIYRRLCQARHLADGTRRIGPSLVGDHAKRAHWHRSRPLRDHLRRRRRLHAGFWPPPRQGRDPAGHGVSGGVARGGGVGSAPVPSSPRSGVRRRRAAITITRLIT